MKELFSSKDDECEGDEDNEKKSNLYYNHLCIGCSYTSAVAFFSFEPRQSIQRQSSYRKHRRATKAPQAIRIMNPNFPKVNMRLFLIEVK